jgi:hypothetical protein
MKGIYGREMYETWYKMSNMLLGGLAERLAPVITHRYKLKDFQARRAGRWEGGKPRGGLVGANTLVLGPLAARF